MEKIDVVVNAGAAIGESPTWSPEEAAVYWIDVKKPALYRVSISDGAQQCWAMPSDIGAFALLERNRGAIVALREGLCQLSFEKGALTRLADPPFDSKLFRFNEGACDVSGRFWVGVMFDPLERKEPPQKAHLHSFTFRDGLRAEPDAAELHNGMAWSEDNRVFYLSHSQKKQIFAFAFDAEHGRLGARRLFADVAANGVPDGAAIDAEGGYWCAIHGASMLRRYTRDGAVDREIDLPVSQPTMCAFGGPDLDILYVTSATDKLTPEQRSREPLAGALFSLRPGVAGIQRHVHVR